MRRSFVATLALASVVVLVPTAAADIVLLNGAVVIYTTGDPGLGSNVGSGSDLRLMCAGTLCRAYGNANGVPIDATFSCFPSPPVGACFVVTQPGSPELVLILVLVADQPWGNCGAENVSGTGPVIVIAAVEGQPIVLLGAVAACSAPGVQCAAVLPVVAGEGEIIGACLAYDVTPHVDPLNPGACVGIGLNERTPSSRTCEGLVIDPVRPCVTTESGFIVVCNV